MQSAHSAKAAFELQPPQPASAYFKDYNNCNIYACPPVLQYLETLQMSTCFYKLSKVHNSQLPMHDCFLKCKDCNLLIYHAILQETELPRVSGVCVAAPLTVHRWFGRYSLPEEEEGGGGGGVEHSSLLLSWQISPLFHPQAFDPWYIGDSKLSSSLRSDWEKQLCEKGNNGCCWRRDSRPPSDEKEKLRRGYHHVGKMSAGKRKPALEPDLDQVYRKWRTSTLFEDRMFTKILLQALTKRDWSATSTFLQHT